MTKNSGFTKIQQAVLLTASCTSKASFRLVMDAGYAHGTSSIQQVHALVTRGLLSRTGHRLTLTDAGQALADALRAAGVEVEP